MYLIILIRLIFQISDMICLINYIFLLKPKKFQKKTLDELLSKEDANYLINVNGYDLFALIATTDYLRKK